MYRAIIPKTLLDAETAIRFGQVSITLKVTLVDTFMPENNCSLIVRFDDGWATQPGSEKYDAEIQMDVSDFSSLIMGAVTFNQLAEYGLATISAGEYRGQVSELFSTPVEPICMTAF
jgi:predicted acetyltransferase